MYLIVRSICGNILIHCEMNMGDWLSGRASRLHRGGRRFESVIAHHIFLFLTIILLLSACGRSGYPERPASPGESNNVSYQKSR